MKYHIKSIIDYFSKKPRALFLLDGFGSAMTSFSLFFVLRNFNDYFGMPANMLAYLSVIGLLYCAYSMICFFVLKANGKQYLKIIAQCNLLYCALTIALLYSYYNSITQIGMIYFVGEFLVIMFIAFIELRVANILGT